MKMKIVTSILLLLLATPIQAKEDPSAELEDLLNKFEELQERIPSLVNRVKELEAKAASQQDYITELRNEDRRLQGECSLSEVTIDSIPHCELTGSLTVEATADFNGTVTIDTENVFVAGKLHTEGAATIDADVDMESSFEIKGKLDLNATETTDIPTKFDGDLEVLHYLTVTGLTELNDDVDFTLAGGNGGGSPDFDATVIIEGAVEAQGSLDFEGETTIYNDVTFDGDDAEVTIDVPVEVEDEVLMGEGSGDLKESVDMEGNLAVDEIVVNNDFNNRKR
jgi:hypothetical protein